MVKKSFDESKMEQLRIFDKFATEKEQITVDEYSYNGGEPRVRAIGVSTRQDGSEYFIVHVKGMTHETLLRVLPGLLASVDEKELKDILSKRKKAVPKK